MTLSHLIKRVLVDLELDFDITGYEIQAWAKDFAFVYKDGRTIVLFPSGTEHKVALDELPNTRWAGSQKDLKISYVILKKT